MPRLLRVPRPHDADQFRNAQAALAPDAFTFAFGYNPDGDFGEYLRSLVDRRAGRNLAEGWVAETFLVAEAEGELVGRLSLRHRLNDFLKQEGGHIGFGVLPRHRRKGYATRMLREGLAYASALGLQRVLLTCDEDNLGSRAVIERCGGHFEGHPFKPAVRHYWVTLGSAGDKPP